MIIYKAASPQVSSSLRPPHSVQFILYITLDPLSPFSVNSIQSSQVVCLFKYSYRYYLLKLLCIRYYMRAFQNYLM